MRRAGYAAVGLSGLAVVLAVWVTGTEAVHLLPGGTNSGQASRLPPGLRQPTNPHGHGRPRPQPKVHDWTSPAVVTIIGYVVLGLVAASLLAFLVGAVVNRTRRRRLARLASFAESADAISALGVPPLVRQAAERQLRALREGTPRNAIVECWMALEAACRAGGLARSPAETSTEFTARVLRDLAVRGDAVDVLAGLYREARFSEHLITEPSRDLAVGALERILADLEGLAGLPVAVATA